MKNKELPRSVQCTALSALWFIWFSAEGWVVWKANVNARLGLRFVNEFQIDAILMGGFPLTLVVTGVLFLRRMRPIAKLPHVYRLLYCVFAVLTAFAAAMLLYGLCWPRIITIRE
jgi:hypothetical protein